MSLSTNLSGQQTGVARNNAQNATTTLAKRQRVTHTKGIAVEGSRAALQKKDTNILRAKQTTITTKDKPLNTMPIHKLLGGTENINFESSKHTPLDGNLDKLLADKEGYDTINNNNKQESGSTATGDDRRNPSPADLSSRAFATKEAEIASLKSKLAEKDDEIAALKRKCADQEQLVKESQNQLERILETHVPRDDIDDLVEENQRLTAELRENEELLAECQKMLEEYVANSSA